MRRVNVVAVITFLDEYLLKTGRQSVGPVEANKLLDNAGLLRDDMNRPGKPLRKLLRDGELPHAYQNGGKGSSWIIPSSSISQNLKIDELSSESSVISSLNNEDMSNAIDIEVLRVQLSEARKKYKPERIKFLLVAEAPPDSIERFFYYENVNTQDSLFTQITQNLYPELKDKYIKNGRSTELKSEMLDQFKSEGFYLLDLSELPISLTKGNLKHQLPILDEKIKSIINSETKIILIKANVYDIAYNHLQLMHGNVVDIRMPFPGSGQQRLFQEKFTLALEIAGYRYE